MWSGRAFWKQTTFKLGLEGWIGFWKQRLMDNLKNEKRERGLTFSRRLYVCQPCARSFYLWYLIYFQWESKMVFSYRIWERGKKAVKIGWWEGRMPPILSQKIWTLPEEKMGNYQPCLECQKRRRERRQQERKGIGSYILLWITGTNNCQPHLNNFYDCLCDGCMLYFIKSFGRILEDNLFHLLLNWINPSTSSQRDPPASLNTCPTGNLTASPCYVSRPLSGKVTFLHSLRGCKAFLWAKISLAAWSFGPRSHTEQHFSIYSKTCFLHVLTTIKSEGGLPSILHYSFNRQQFFLKANKIMMHFIASGISNAIKHSKIIFYIRLA